eukprot:NODE_72_length_24857_cov_0.454399.p12 type:complete len:242 gc:universal NODE_72_length_24857_cov_0.454399:7033-6308(-)
MSGNISYDLPSTLTSIDMSGNNLTGNIPNWQINSTRDYFNISNNYFIGSISQSLQYVNTLDLSHNHLSGCISFQLKGSSFYLNNNYLSGNLSFMAPSQLSISNNFVTNVVIYNSTGLQKCDLSNNPLAPGVFGKTFKNQCNLSGIYATTQSSCRILALNETSESLILVAETITMSSNANGASHYTETNQPDATQTETHTNEMDASPTIVTRILYLCRTKSYYFQFYRINANFRRRTFYHRI